MARNPLSIRLNQGIGQIIIFPRERGWRSLAACLGGADPQDRDEDLEIKMKIMTDSNICALCGGKLRDGLTELVLKAGDELAVIKRIPTLVCNCCHEAYLNPDVSEKIDQVMKEYRAGKLLARPIAAGEIELEMSA